VFAALTRLPVQPRIHPVEAARIATENILPHFEFVSLGKEDYRLYDCGWNWPEVLTDDRRQKRHVKHPLEERTNLPPAWTPASACFQRCRSLLVTCSSQTSVASRGAKRQSVAPHSARGTPKKNSSRPCEG
jgi:hypothetical protein